MAKKKRGPDHRVRAIIELDEKQLKLVESALLREALRGDVRACKFILVNRLPERWKPDKLLDGSLTNPEAKMILRVITTTHNPAKEDAK